jgi:ABC-type amino acid transport substrate-binding protein
MLACLLCATNVAAQQQSGVLKRIAETGEMRIGYVPDAPPLSFEDSDGSAVGYSIDLCRHIAASIRNELGMESIDLVFVPLIAVEERIGAVEEGRVDIECGATTVTLSRRKRVDFTLMTFITGSAVLSRSGNSIDSIADLEGKRIAVLGGSTTEDVLRRVAEEGGLRFKILLTETHDEGMEHLNNRDVDGFVSDRAMLLGQVFRNNNAKKEYKMTSDTMSFEPYAMIVPRGDTEFRLAADRALASLFRTQRIRRIYQNWFGRYGEPLSPIVAAMYQFQAVGE